MKKLVIFILLLTIFNTALSQNYYYYGCVSPCYSQPSNGNGALDITNDELGNGLIFLYGDLISNIGKLDSNGIEIWENVFNDAHFRYITNGTDNGYYVLGTRYQTGDTILSSLTSEGFVKWTIRIKSFPNFEYYHLSYNKNSSQLILYGEDNNGIKIMDFDTLGVSKWVLSLPPYEITKCVTLANGNFLFNCIAKNNSIVFSVDSLGNILYPYSFSFNHYLSNSTLVCFKDKYFLSAQEDTTNDVYIIYSTINGQVINSKKIENGNHYGMADLYEWKDWYLNLIIYRNDSIYCLDIDSAIAPFYIYYSYHLSHYYDSWYYAGDYTYINKFISDKQGIVILIDDYFYDGHFDFDGNYTIIFQLNRLGRGCPNDIVKQICYNTPFTILSNPILIPDTFKQITVWNDSIKADSSTLSFNKGCSGYANINNPTEETQNVSIYPNPTTNNLTIDAGDLQGTNYKLQIYDIVGNLVLEKTLNNKVSTIDVSTLKGGVYIVEVRTEKGVESRKFIKL